VLCLNNAIAQPNKALNLDSLIKKSQETKIDTTRVGLFLTISDQLRAKEPEQSIHYLEKSLVILKKNPWDKGWGMYYQLKGKTFGMLGKHREAIMYFDSSINFLLKANLIQKAIKSYIYLGMVYTRINNYSLAYQSFRNGLHRVNKKVHVEEFLDLNDNIASLYDKMGDIPQAIEKHKINEAYALAHKNMRRVMISKGNIGQSLAGLGQYHKGLDLLLQSLNYFDSINEPLMSRTIHINLAHIYFSLNDYSEALKWLNKAKEICLQANSKYEEIMVRKNMSQVYLKLGNKRNALKEIRNIMVAYSEMGDSLGLAKTYQFMGDYYKELNDRDKALDAYFLAQSTAQHMGNKEFDLDILQSIAVTYFEENNYTASAKFFDQALTLARTMSMLKEIGEIYAYKASIAESQGNFKEALKNHKESIVYKDSINIQNQQMEVEKVKFKYEAALKDEEIERLEADNAHSAMLLKQNKLQHRLWFVVFTLVVLVLFVLILLFGIRKNATYQTREAELKLQVLRAQMNPHFIFNALSSIHSYLWSNNANAASDYLLKFSKLMRKVLNNSIKNEITLAEEIEMLSMYLELESSRLNNKFTFDFFIDSGIIPEETLIPPLLLQPFLENSVWHGIANKQEKGEIMVRFELEGDYINCIIRDNGIGRVKSRELLFNFKLQNKSMGLELTQQRLHMLNVKKKFQHTLTFNDLQEGLEVKLQIPLQLLY
jgi:tetratricopeptide (TPR) repeat protein